MTDAEPTLSARGTIVLGLEDALHAIAHFTRAGKRVERWEGSVVLRNGQRIRSLEHGGTFALSRDPARAAAFAEAGMRKASATWARRPEFEGAILEFEMAFA